MAEERPRGLGPAQPGVSGGGLPAEVLPPRSGRCPRLCLPCCGFSCRLLFPQPYVPRDPPVLRVTEGPFFSEVVAYYEHVRQVVRLYNLPGEPCRSEGPRGGGGCRGVRRSSFCSRLMRLFPTEVSFAVGSQ